MKASAMKKLKKHFIKFWKSEDERIVFLRDILIMIIAGLIVLSSLWIYTAQPFPKAPMVVIESGSMMHRNPPYGRLGTIDPGDIVLVKAVHSHQDVNTQADGKGKTYGDYGDVLIYRPMNRTDRTPIIHRAICWVELNEWGRYNVPEYGIVNESSITIPELRISNYRPLHSGFITAGDHNLELGGGADQASSICPQPVKVEWIIGKARGEIPWLGALKLAITGNNASPEKDWIRFGNAMLPKDVVTMAVLSLVFIFLIPFIPDFVYALRRRK